MGFFKNLLNLFQIMKNVDVLTWRKIDLYPKQGCLKV